MLVRGVMRFDTKQVQAARAGRLTQLRAKANLYDPDARGRRLSKAGQAKPGDLFWLGEPAVYWTASGGRQTDLVFPSENERGMAYSPQWIAGCHNLKRHSIRPDKLARANSRRCLEVIENRLERLRSITSADAEASGAIFTVRDGRGWYRMVQEWHAEGATPQEAYLEYWRRLHRPADASEANPIVAVISFRLIEENADDYLEKLNADAGALAVANEAVGERAA